ncbi:hypothetical protein H1Z61_12110 [Bacillus aquiflavi]|uniref:Uncharacterized protein n=1 Tax=Bacillus aquiflavi TaxID=2672567 RepID=A0A6B3W0S0_9BACI|nr:hypothetical protein [Bacillus aquiflavi]MBA4537851.1 hypothetical protein [Bacillus aquiflavi]NEY82107.1 hypothetical protein [Bacillus aquiflavi]
MEKASKLKTDIEQRRHLFLKELDILTKKQYTTNHTANTIKEAYQRLYEERLEIVKQLNEDQHPLKKETIEKDSPPAPVIQHKPVPVKEISPEARRERNISILLSIGVAMLLIAGFTVAITNWNTMHEVTKTLSIAAVAMVFFSFSWLCEKQLSIQKTAFSFGVLGNLFLPIVIFTAGFYRLFGEWLSIFGSGKYVLGFLASALLLPLYGFYALRLKSRFYVWLCYITISIGVSFFLASLKLTIDLFFFGVALCNGLLIIAYVKKKIPEKLRLFTNDFLMFIHIQLIISTVLMTFIFEVQAMHSLNLFLFSGLYLAMMFARQRTEYHIGFTLLLIYAVYQFSEQTIFNEINAIFYALVGFIYISLERLFQKNPLFIRIFRMTSAALSSLAFLAISLKAITIYEAPSLFIFLAYLIVTANFVWLAYHTKWIATAFIAPVFLEVTILYGMYLLVPNVSPTSFPVLLFISGVILYGLSLLFKRYKYTLTIASATFVIFLCVIPFAALLKLSMIETAGAALQLFIYGIILIHVHKTTSYPLARQAIPWVQPISWALAWILIYQDIIYAWPYYEMTFNISFHLTLGSVLLLCTAFIWKRLKDIPIVKSTGATAIAYYLFALSTLPFAEMNELFVRTGILAFGIFLSELVRKVSKDGRFHILTNVFVLFTYLSLVDTIDVGNTVSEFLFLLIKYIGGVILLLFISKRFQSRAPWLANSAFYLAHIYLPMSLFITLSETNWHPVSLLLSVCIYIYSVLTWPRLLEQRILSLVAYVHVPLAFILTINFYSFPEELYAYTGFFSSSILFLITFVLKDIRKRDAIWLNILFSSIGMIILISSSFDYEVAAFIIITLYSGLIVFLFHQMKWYLLQGIPLLMQITAIRLLPFDELTNALFALSFAIIFKIIGKQYVKKPYDLQAPFLLAIKIDSFTIMSFLYTFSMYLWIDSSFNLLIQLLPSFVIVYLLYSQMKRFDSIFEKRIIQSLTATALLAPYFTLLNGISINPFIKMELYVLPFVALAFYLRWRIWNDLSISSIVEWFVLGIASFVLFFDAYTSNTVIDAILIGSLALLAIIGGFIYKVKAYFITGIAVLFITLFVYSRPFFQALPWWVYLLVGGLMLIAVASFYEWQKQRVNDEGKTLLQEKWASLLEKWRQWK